MTAVSPTYEISIPVEASHDEALALARAIEWWLGSDPDPDRPLHAIGLGAIAVRPLEPEPTGGIAGALRDRLRRRPVSLRSRAA